MIDYWQRYSEKAIHVLMLAQEESRRMHQNFVGTEALVLGLIGEGNGIAAGVLRSSDVRLIDLRMQVEKIIGRGLSPSPDQIPFTPRAKRIIELAWTESQHRGVDRVGTAHILLALMTEREGVGCRVLANAGIDLEQIRIQLIGRLADVGSVSEND